MSAGEAQPLRVRPLDDGDRGRWEAFVADCPEATFFHRAGWRRVIEEGLRHRTTTCWRSAGCRRGILPPPMCAAGCSAIR
jgi:hypothetical protein